jgi:hypothetical protein
VRRGGGFLLFEERERARAGDGPDALDQVRVGHADAGVLDGQAVPLGVEVDPDLQRGVRALHVAVGEHPEAHLVEGVGGVGDQLAEEHLRVRVERMDDEVQQLPHLRPVLERLRLLRIDGRFHGQFAFRVAGSGT